MAITKLTNHDNHQIQIHLTKPNSKHYAALRCVDCNKHIQWISNLDVDQLKAANVKIVKHWVTPEELGI